MVNIETRQNGKFTLGYPYNSKVDEYFKSLSTEFIDNYGLTTTDVNTINDHKNKTFQFDKDLHEFLIKLSAFKKGFEEEGVIIINEFDELKSTYLELKEKVDSIGGASLKSQTEFSYMQDNIITMKDDLVKINEMILFYESQLIDDTFLYTDDYLVDTESRLAIIDNIINTNDNENIYYETMIKNQISEYTTELDKLKPYGGFKEISLRNHYEAWLQRKETYYTTLVEYFKDEYESYWTYGQSLMYGEKLSEAEAKKINVDNVYDEWKERLFKGYEFKIEKELKEYSLSWLSERSTFEMIDFTKAIEEKRMAILTREIPLLEQLVTTKNNALRSVVSYEKEKNYLKYMELIQLKRQHIYSNILSNTINLDMLNDYDAQIQGVEADYLYVKAKMEQDTYWLYYYDLERHQSMLVEMNRLYDVVQMAISRNFQKELGSNEDLYKKINYYEVEQKDVEQKIIELTQLKDKLEIEINMFNDELTLLKSKMFEAQQLMGEKSLEYMNYFSERIPFFTQNIEKTEKDGINDLLDKKFYRGLDDIFETLKSYNTNVVWFDSESRKNLFNHYTMILEYLNNSVKDEWEKEFSHEILSLKKFDYYIYYIETKLPLIYGEIHKFVLDAKFDESFQSNINEQLKNIREKFGVLVVLGFNLSKDISINPDIFDYDDKFKFRISDGVETLENIMSTFDGFINTINGYISKKNLEFRIKDRDLEDRLKIDRIWNDMEKKYV